MPVMTEDREVIDWCRDKLERLLTGWDAYDDIAKRGTISAVRSALDPSLNPKLRSFQRSEGQD
jgi:hypothetical protein